MSGEDKGQAQSPGGSQESRGCPLAQDDLRAVLGQQQFSALFVDGAILAVAGVIRAELLQASPSLAKSLLAMLAGAVVSRLPAGLFCATNLSEGADRRLQTLQGSHSTLE